MNAQETVSAVAQKTGDIGAAFYFTPETVGRGKEFGLGGFYFYIIAGTDAMHAALNSAG